MDVNEIEEAKGELVVNWLTLITTDQLPIHNRPDTKTCFVFIKYLIDNEWPDSFKPNSFYELEKINYIMELMPEPLRPSALKLYSAWKTQICRDPEEYIIGTPPVPA